MEIESARSNRREEATAITAATAAGARGQQGEARAGPAWVQQYSATGDYSGRGWSRRRRSRIMGFVSWFKRHYYHYCISTGTYSFYPAESVMVNAGTFTLFSVTAYYILRCVWFGALFMGELVSPKA